MASTLHHKWSRYQNAQHPTKDRWCNHVTWSWRHNIWQVDRDNYTCIVNIEGAETQLAATWVNSTKVVCATNHTFHSSATAGEVIAPVRVGYQILYYLSITNDIFWFSQLFWKFQDWQVHLILRSHSFNPEAVNLLTRTFQVLWNSKEIEAEKQPEIDIYRCNVLGNDCSSCRANSMLRGCGWCQEQAQCLLKSRGYNTCPSSYSSVCADLSIESFEPKHGPVEGGTLVTIRGTNLGSRPGDITSIKIAGQ